MRKLELQVLITPTEQVAMYLVHLHLLSHSQGSQLPEETADLMAASAAGFVRIDHVSVHARASPRPVIGVYLRADTLDTAEAMAELAWWRTAAAHQPLRAWQLVKAEAPLLPPEA